jgi:hypothetical protein
MERVGWDVVVLSAICVTGLALSVIFIVWWGRLPTRVERHDEPEPARATDVVLRYLRTCAIAVSAGVVAGVLVGGLGGRLAMRILAATSGDDVQGALTDAEERVGDITVGGTLGLVIFVGILGGIVGGLVFMMLRRWLPNRAWMAGLAIGLLLLFIARADPLDPKSVDLEILSPELLAVALFLALFPLYGMVLASLVARFDRSYPVLSRRPRVVAAYVPLLPVLLVPPLAVALVVGAGIDVFARAPRFTRKWREHRVDLAGRAVLVVAGALSVVWVGIGTAEIIGG